MVRPLGPTSVIPAVTAFLNRLLFEIEEEKLQKGLRFFCCFLSRSAFFARLIQISLTPPAGLFVTSQALSCLLTLDSSADLLSLIAADKINAILRYLAAVLLPRLLQGFFQTRDRCAALHLAGSSPPTRRRCCSEICSIPACPSAASPRI